MKKVIKIGVLFTGGGNWFAGKLYIKNLINAIYSLSEDEKQQFRVSLLYDRQNKVNANLIKDKVDSIIEIPSWFSLFQSIKNPISKRVQFFDRSFLNPFQMDFLYPFYAGKKAPFSWGSWIPDFQHIHLPHLFLSTEIKQRNYDHKRIASHAPVIILSSQDAKKDFCNIHPKASDRCEVMHFSSILDADWLNMDPVETIRKYRLEKRFLLVCNQFWRHKNHQIVIESLKLLKEQGEKVNIVCTGDTKDVRNPFYFNELTDRIKKYGLEGQIKILGFLPRCDQIQIMRCSLAIIQPSLFEGWSTVVEDARSLGKPMILSDIAVHYEQSPKRSVFYEKGNADKLANAIKAFMSKYNPGPDYDKESAAQKESVNRTTAFGRKFINIVNKAVG